MSEVPKGTLKTMLWEATQRINTLEAEVNDLRTALEGMIERWSHLSDEELTEMPRVVDSRRIMAARAALNRWPAPRREVTLRPEAP